MFLNSRVSYLSLPRVSITNILVLKEIQRISYIIIITNHYTPELLILTRLELSISPPACPHSSLFSVLSLKHTHLPWGQLLNNLCMNKSVRTCLSVSRWFHSVLSSSMHNGTHDRIPFLCKAEWCCCVYILCHLFIHWLMLSLLPFLGYYINNAVVKMGAQMSLQHTAFISFVYIPVGWLLCTIW